MVFDADFSSSANRLSDVALLHMSVFDLNRLLYQRLQGCAAIVAALCLGIAEIEVAVPAPNREQVAPSSDRPWAPPDLPAYENALRNDSARTLEKGKGLVDARKEYTLVDLIDLAEQLNPATRAAQTRPAISAAMVAGE